MIYRASAQSVACAYGDGVAILSLKSNRYFSLDPVGTVVWTQLEKDADINGLVEAVTQEFDVEPEVCREDIEQLLASMLNAELIESRA
ncbi:PqqD family protein [Sagittula sp. S175]|uniref:PqqD family protein n=1 Tax=Sagittula sp. S175 TaxID=3415129 RepID=UPI003C7D5DE9